MWGCRGHGLGRRRDLDCGVVVGGLFLLPMLRCGLVDGLVFIDGLAGVGLVFGVGVGVDGGGVAVDGEGELFEVGVVVVEQGVEQRNIQALLGHRDPKSTEVYLHVSNKSIMGIRSPFDRKDGTANG